MSAASDLNFEQARQRFFQGLDCHQAGRYADAVRHYQASLALVPGRASTLVNLAAAQLQLGLPADALASADQALATEPDGVDALFHRAGALHRLGRPVEALAAYQRVTTLDPTHTLAFGASGSLLRELNRRDEAAHAFREALRLGADPELHGYYLSSVSSQQAPPAIAPAAYVQTLFDGYADEFNRHLVGQLGYDAHRRLVDTLVSLAPGPFQAALDLGCGTGLCGPLVRPIARRLAGVDLSAGMLAKAEALAAYDSLQQADVVAFMAGSAERFDLVLAADVFIYIGDLDPVFAAVRRVMDRGVFCFSVELTADPGAHFQLLPSLRYAHGEAYLRQLAAKHGFGIIEFRPATLREEQRRPVAGLFVYLRA